MSQDWDEIEALRASLREHMAEIKRLNECLTWEQHRAEHVGTHGPGCAMWGPKHYECLLRAHDALKTQTVLREALQKRINQNSRQVEPSKREPITIEKNEFVGDPPAPFSTWGDFFDDAITNKRLSGLRVSSLANKTTHGIGGEE